MKKIVYTVLDYLYDHEWARVAFVYGSFLCLGASIISVDWWTYTLALVFGVLIYWAGLIEGCVSTIQQLDKE